MRWWSGDHEAEGSQAKRPCEALRWQHRWHPIDSPAAAREIPRFCILPQGRRSPRHIVGMELPAQAGEGQLPHPHRRHQRAADTAAMFDSTSVFIPGMWTSTARPCRCIEFLAAPSRLALCCKRSASGVVVTPRALRYRTAAEPSPVPARHRVLPNAGFVS